MAELNLKLFIVTLFVFVVLIANESAFSQTDSLVVELENAYQQFDYEKCNQIINAALPAIEKFSTDEKIAIYKIAGLIAYNNDNLPVAENHFWNLLEIDPTFEMDPLKVSPKHVTFFNKVKIDFLKELNLRLTRMKKSLDRERPTLLEFAVPGLAQIKRGAKKSGAIFLGSSAIFLGGLVYSIWDTRNKKSDYENQTEPQAIREYYDKYNTAYKRQYYWGYALFGNWVLSHLHAYFLPAKVPQFSFLYSRPENSFALRFQYTF